MLHAGTNPIVLDVEPDARVLAFTLVVSVVTSVVFGLVPAFKATRVDVTPSLKAADSGVSLSVTGRHGARGGRALVVGQVALCFVLLTGGALLVRSLVLLKAQEAGFRRENVLLFYLDARGSETKVTAHHDTLLERVRAIPGVRSGAFSTMSPLATDGETRPVRIAGEAKPRVAVTNRITPDYFATFGIQLLRGREIVSGDTATAARVAVVNETMARDYFGGDALGRTFVFGSRANEPVTVVGVARDNLQPSLRRAAPPMAYVPLAQAEEPPDELTGSVQFAGDRRALEGFVRAAVRDASPDLVVSYVRTIEQQVDASLMPERLLATMSTAFVTVALFLGAIGLYGVMSYGVARRSREIGVRMALGASRGMVMWQVLRATAVLVSTGIAIGALVAYQATRLVSSFLYGVTDRDPLAFAFAAIVLFAAAVLAGYMPARRATRIDPLSALRAE
jgi:predicted permease